MNLDSKIYIAGHRGLVGSALVRRLTTPSHLAGEGIITRTHAELDLIRQPDVEEFFAQEQPDYVFLAAWQNQVSA